MGIYRPNNPRAANWLIQTIVTPYLRLEDTPGMGRDRSELRPGIRSLPVKSYVIFYRFDEERVFVVRVLHGARNMRAVVRKETEETDTEEDEG